MHNVQAVLVQKIIFFIKTSTVKVVHMIYVLYLKRHTNDTNDFVNITTITGMFYKEILFRSVCFKMFNTFNLLFLELF